MAFTLMAPNFFRYFLGCWVRDQEEGHEFSLKELKQLFAIKQNNGLPGTMILAPRGGRVIIEGIPNKDDRWRDKFFVFKINPASVGDFDFERIPREWSDDIGESHFVLVKDVCCFLLFFFFKKRISFIYRAFWGCAYVSRALQVNGAFA